MMWFVITSSLSSVFWVDLQQARRSLEVRAPRGNLAVPPSLVWAFQCGPGEDQSDAARDKNWARVYSPSDSWNLSISEQSCSVVGWADLSKMR